MAEELNKPERWYSIKEAAKYLEIGEPTLYRWMRDRKITYRKVGDSTRFFQEDLDAVVEVFHSKKEASDAKTRCPVCRGDDLIPGIYRSTGLLHFQPKRTKFWTLRDSSVKSEALMCADCGYVSIYADTKKLAKLREFQRLDESEEPLNGENNNS